MLGWELLVIESKSLVYKCPNMLGGAYKIPIAPWLCLHPNLDLKESREPARIHSVSLP